MSNCNLRPGIITQQLHQIIDIQKENMKKFDIVKDTPLYFSRSESRQNYDIYLLGEIKSPEHYMEVFNVIQTATAHDVVNLYINSGGGDFWTAMQFISTIAKAECHIHASIEGEAHSAASMIFLACHTYSVPDFASMLCHYFSSGYYGKGEEIAQWSHHVERHYKKIFKDLYKNFLTDAEIDDMINGKDYWLTGVDIVERLNNKVKIEELEDKKEKQLPASKPKKKKRMKKSNK